MDNGQWTMKSLSIREKSSDAALSANSNGMDKGQ